MKYDIASGMICVMLNAIAALYGLFAMARNVAAGDCTSVPDHGIVLWNTSKPLPTAREPLIATYCQGLSTWNGRNFCAVSPFSTHMAAPRSAGSPMSLRDSAASFDGCIGSLVTGSISFRFLYAHA